MWTTAKLFRRQIALIDVDDGEGSQELAVEQQLPGEELAGGVTTANSYVFDVFRVGGGNQHTYCFHGALNDEFTWNATNVKPPAEGSDDAEYLSRFRLMPELNHAGDAPDTLEATWRMAREAEGSGAGEKEMLRKNYDPDAPRKYTRLHLFGTDGARALRGEFVCKQWKYHFTNLMVRTRQADQPTPRAFAALVEPYAGEPFITARRMLRVAGNDSDAKRAVAVEVRTSNGHTDVCFADGQSNRVRSIPEAKLKVAGEFAFYSTDDAGLRQATVVGGQTLESPLVRIATETAEWRGAITRVDYAARKMWIDKPWPESFGECVFEVGIPNHWTTYTAASIEPAGKGSVMTLRRGADYFRSQIEEVDTAESSVTTTLRPLVEHVDHNRAGWVASDEQCRTFWRATYLGEGRFRLEDGPPVTERVFGEAGVLRLWEYGTGDAVRQSTSVSLRRLESRAFELTAHVPVAISLPGKGLSISVNGRKWKPADAVSRNGWTTVELPADERPLYLKIDTP